MTEHAGDDHVETGEHEEDLQHGDGRAPGRGEQSRAADEADHPDQDASHPLRWGDIDGGPLHDGRPFDCWHYECRAQR